MTTIELRPIAEANVRPDDELGPCILAVGSRWLTGYWNGEGWYSLEGDPVQPSRFGLLPQIERQRPQPQPIATAPKVEGEMLLLFDPVNTDHGPWTIGCWEEPRGWFEQEGFPVQPLYWAPMPVDPRPSV